MPTPSLMVICGVAFLAVFFVLTFLAGVMRALTKLFPQLDATPESIDPAIVTAITEGTKFTYPGMRVTVIEEIK
jgi:Na+-transporting methylmalonyl-CoA/oxaloacetate decarboxylase gamma subunit